MNTAADSSRDLDQFFAGYFNQDWDVDASSSDDIVDLFLNLEPLSQIESVAGELSRLLKRARNDQELSSLIYRAGCEFDPTADGYTLREWLTRVADRIQSHLARVSYGPAS